MVTLACRHAWLDSQGVLHNPDNIEYIFQDKIVIHKPAGQINPTKWSKTYTQNIM